MKIKKKGLKTLGKGIIAVLMVQSCLWGFSGPACAVNPESAVMAGMEALVGELGWVSETVEIAGLESSDEYVLVSVSGMAEYTTPAVSYQREDLEAYVE